MTAVAAEYGIEILGPPGIPIRSRTFLDAPASTAGASASVWRRSVRVDP
jgi:hypothetical protein